jgi:hypothetical protein
MGVCAGMYMRMYALEYSMAHKHMLSLRLRTKARYSLKYRTNPLTERMLVVRIKDGCPRAAALASYHLLLP